MERIIVNKSFISNHLWLTFQNSVLTQESAYKNKIKCKYISYIYKLSYCVLKYTSNSEHHINHKYIFLFYSHQHDCKWLNIKQHRSTL